MSKDSRVGLPGQSSGKGRSTAKKAGVVGLVAAGAAVGLAIERYATGRIRSNVDSGVTKKPEPFGRLRADRHSTVNADDGVPLYVEEVGPLDAGLCVIFVHGYCLNMGSWHFQRQGLSAMTNPHVRMVFYDQRCHGNSGEAPSCNANIDQLGRDLATVIDKVAPTSPVVLIGHSMGAMAVMALADQQPERFGSQITGVALLSSSTGKLTGATLGLPTMVARAMHQALPRFFRGARRSAKIVERSRRIGTDLAYVITRRLSFGSKDVGPALAAYVHAMISATPIEAISDFYPALTSHDKLAAIDVLESVESLILVGDGDVMTPPSHSAAIHEALPSSQFVVVSGGGHMAMMERPDIVNLQLRAFLHRAARRGGRAEQQDA